MIHVWKSQRQMGVGAIRIFCHSLLRGWGVLTLWKEAVQRGKGSHRICSEVITLQPYIHIAFLLLLDLQLFMVRGIHQACVKSSLLQDPTSALQMKCARWHLSVPLQPWSWHSRNPFQCTRVTLLGAHFSKLYWDVYLTLGFSPITVSSFKHGIHNSQVKSIYQLP